MEQAMTLFPVLVPAGSLGRHAQPPSADAEVQPCGCTSRVCGLDDARVVASGMLDRRIVELDRLIGAAPFDGGPRGISSASRIEKAFRTRPAVAFSKSGS